MANRLIIQARFQGFWCPTVADTRSSGAVRHEERCAEPRQYLIARNQSIQAGEAGLLYGAAESDSVGCQSWVREAAFGLPLQADSMVPNWLAWPEAGFDLEMQSL